MKIGIISDTHNILPKSVFKHFEDVEYIFHAGDIGSLKILKNLGKIAKVIAVYGNIDSSEIRKEIPSINFITLDERKICLLHDIGNVKKFDYQLFKLNKNPDIIIHGHTHSCSFDIYQKKIYINPGSVSFPRMSEKRTIAIAEIDRNTFNHKFIVIE